MHVPEFFLLYIAVVVGLYMSRSAGDNASLHSALSAEAPGVSAGGSPAAEDSDSSSGPEDPPVGVPFDPSIATEEASAGAAVPVSDGHGQAAHTGHVPIGYGPMLTTQWGAMHYQHRLVWAFP